MFRLLTEGNDSKSADRRIACPVDGLLFFARLRKVMLRHPKGIRHLLCKSLLEGGFSFFFLR